MMRLGVMEKIDIVESLSDNDDLHEVTYDINCSKNLQSLYSHQGKEPMIPATQVESLKGYCHQPTFSGYEEDFRMISPSKLPEESLQTEHEHGKLVCSDTWKDILGYSGYESISDEENDARSRFSFTSPAATVQRGINPEKGSLGHACEWPAILQEVNELAGLQEKSYNSFNSCVLHEESRFHKGGDGNYRFLVRPLPSKEEFSRACSSSNNETFYSFEEDIEVAGEQDYFEHPAEEVSLPRILGNIVEEIAELNNKQGFDKQLVGAPSVTELLDEMQKTNPIWGGNLGEDTCKEKDIPRSFSTRRLSYLGDRVLDNKDLSEFTCEISSEEEAIDHEYQNAQNVKGRTMVDMFQETFKTSAEDVAGIPGSNKFGYHGRLQKVMQLVKDRQITFFKHARQDTSNESDFIDVRILSRTLEAKLTVCQCFFGECNKAVGYEKIDKKICERFFLDGSGNGRITKKTFIFSPAFCGHVELEVGNIVRIHSPWKEVQVAGGDTIILCTYFSSPPL